MTKLYNNRVIYAKIEVTKGTDATPAGTDAVATKNFQWSDPYAGDRVSRDLDGPSLGLEAEINVNPHVTFSFDVEIAGSGTAGTAPAFAALLLASGFAETVDVGVDVQYDPVSTFTDSVTVYVVIDGDVQKVLGTVGSVAWNFQKGIPTFTFNMTGQYATPITDAAPLTPDFTAYQDPLPMTKANTTFSIDAYSPPLISLSGDMSLNIFPRNVPNQEEILQTDRGVTGSIVFDAPTIATKDIFTDLVESHSGINTGVIALVHGTVAGNIVEFDAPSVQLSTVSEGDESGLDTYTANARYIPSSGDDEVKFTFK